MVEEESGEEEEEEEEEVSGWPVGTTDPVVAPGTVSWHTFLSSTFIYYFLFSFLFIFCHY